MKVLLYDTTNAYLTPGGKTTHAIKLQQEIAKLGVDIQFAEWWNVSQKDCDIIHFLVEDPYVAKLAKQNGKKTFCSMIFDHVTNLSYCSKARARLSILLKKCLLPEEAVRWNALKYMDTIQFMHIEDRKAALDFFSNSLNENNTIIIPHAYDPLDMCISNHLNIGDFKFPQKYLISCANINPRKQTVKLAQFAKEAKVPIVFMGGRNINDPYYQEFAREIDNKYVFDPGYVSKEWKDCIESHASGYILLSLGESGCIAVYEAAAYNIPIMLSNLPWAWGYENPTDIYFCDQNNKDVAINQIKAFYENACRLDHPPFTIHTWSEIAQRYVTEYTKLINSKI